MMKKGKFTIGARDFGIGTGSNDFTQQNAAEYTNINKIMQRATGRGQVRQAPVFGDFSKVGSYQECLGRIQEADKEFMSLPASIRQRFQHNPQNLMNFLDNQNNKEEAIALGLIEKAVENKPAETAPTK